MNIYLSELIKRWDAVTIEQESITSIKLMNRAALAFTGQFKELFPNTSRQVIVTCGFGNNGGDGLAIARYLHQADYNVNVWLPKIESRRSQDFEVQFEALPMHGAVGVHHIDPAAPNRKPSSNAVIIDALFGTGLSRPLEGKWAEYVEFINQLPNMVVAVDLPSGLPADSVVFGPTIQAEHTITFERPKLACFFPENEEILGDWNDVPIGLIKSFDKETQTPYHLTDMFDIRGMYRPRRRFSHKGNFGHGLLIAGGYGKMGAAVLAARGALRAGIGLLTVHAPRTGNLVLQTAVPEAMHSPDARARQWTSLPEVNRYAAIGVGPGIGQAPETAAALKQLLSKTDHPLVLDADALNLLAAHPDWWPLVPKNSILTPHPREFERLFGTNKNSRERLDQLIEKAVELQLIIVLKRAFTAVALPDGNVWFNTTGNSGMATGGSGDVLTGIITALLAQGYAPADAARLGVYLHGKAGDLAAQEIGREALVAGDLAEWLGKAFLNLFHASS